MKDNIRKCRVCYKPAQKLVVGSNSLLPLCAEHLQRLESEVGEIDPITNIKKILVEI